MVFPRGGSFEISDIGLDIQDDMGRHEVGFKDNTQKFPENDDTGCRMESHFLINKVGTKIVYMYGTLGCCKDQIEQFCQKHGT